MPNKIRYTFISLVAILIIFLININNTSYSQNNELSKKVLILGSYDSQNKWEESIIKGLQESIDENISIKVDFLDSKSIDTDIYNKSFIDLLNLKYKNDSIDCILTIDDEALELVRNNLFKEESFIYKKPIVFVGANSKINLNDEEKKYITGIFQQQDTLYDLDLILSCSSNVDNIYLVLDNSVYSNTLKDNIKAIQNLTIRPFNIHTIQDYRFNNIEKNLKNIDDKNSAIILCGTYTDEDGQLISPDKIVKSIKNITNSPIYTKTKFYVEAGAIGGIINDGHRLGNMASNFLYTVLYEENKRPIMPSYNSINTPIYNYDSLMYYDINPFKLPKNSVFINKGLFDLLLPKKIILIAWSLIAIAVFSVILFIYIYIDNKKKVNENKRLLRESLERHEIKTDFILTVSHELRTPLNIIINATKLLKRKIDKNQYSNEFAIIQLDMINKNTNRLIRLVNNLIDVSKIETGHIDTTFINENIVDVVEDATLSVVDLAKSHNIDIIFDTDEEEIITAIDKSKIERVMLNLLSNAIKFTRKDGKIFVSIKKDDNNVIIEVKDNGIGMNEDLQAHLFEKFRRAKPHSSLEQKHEGSGLGLFIVKGLIEVHKGSIYVESAINKGTTFTIYIPMVVIDAQNDKSGYIKMPIDYLSEIELADIDNQKQN